MPAIISTRRAAHARLCLFPPWRETRHLHQEGERGNYQHCDFACLLRLWHYHNVTVGAGRIRKGVWPPLLHLGRGEAGPHRLVHGGSHGAGAWMRSKASPRGAGGCRCSLQSPRVGILIQSVISATAARRSSADCTPSICCWRPFTTLQRREST